MPENNIVKLYFDNMKQGHRHVFRVLLLTASFGVPKFSGYLSGTASWNVLVI
jgi:hypothetical protein